MKKHNLLFIALFALCSTVIAAGTSTTVLHGSTTGNGTYSKVSQTADITGTTPVVNGGTGTTTSTGTGSVVLSNSPTLVTPVLGTPASGDASNLTGTAAGLTAGTVTTNADLTGPIKSTGNVTATTAQTGMGSTFVMNTSPTLVTPVISGMFTSTFAGQWFSNTVATTGSSTFYLANTSGDMQVGVETSAGGTLGSGTTANAAIFGNIANKPVQIVANNIMEASFKGTGATLNGTLALPGLASSSAATTGTLCWTTGTGNVNVDTTTTCLLSARKYKKDIQPLDEGLQAVLALRPVSYSLRGQYNPTHLGRQVGFIADEVQKVDERLVSVDKDGTAHAVRYQQMIALLTKAIQEQQEQINMLKKDIYKHSTKYIQVTTPAILH